MSLESHVKYYYEKNMRVYEYELWLNARASSAGCQFLDRCGDLITLVVLLPNYNTLCIGVIQLELPMYIALWCVLHLLPLCKAERHQRSATPPATPPAPPLAPLHMPQPRARPLPPLPLGLAKLPLS